MTLRESDSFSLSLSFLVGEAVLLELGVVELASDRLVDVVEELFLAEVARLGEGEVAEGVVPEDDGDLVLRLGKAVLPAGLEDVVLGEDELVAIGEEREGLGEHVDVVGVVGELGLGEDRAVDGADRPEGGHVAGHLVGKALEVALDVDVRGDVDPVVEDDAGVVFLVHGLHVLEVLGGDLVGEHELVHLARGVDEGGDGLVHVDVAFLRPFDDRADLAEAPGEVHQGGEVDALRLDGDRVPGKHVRLHPVDVAGDAARDGEDGADPDDADRGG